MRYGVPLACVLLFGSIGVWAADPPRKDEETARLDKAIDDALAFLQKQQLADGSWAADGGQGASPAITGLCVMAFLSGGNVPGEGRYGETIQKGVRFVLDAQLPNGLLARGAGGNQEMYSHGICTLMLAEVVGMTDGKLAEEVRPKLKRAVEATLAAQNNQAPPSPARGGWRYQPNYGDSDMSVTGWQIMALRAARNVGCDVPSRNIDEAVAFIKRCKDAGTGGFDYQPGSNLTVPVTGTSILALELCGKEEHKSALVISAGDFLRRQVVDRYNNPQRAGGDFRGMHLFGNFPYYGVYYCSQAMFQLGDSYWDSYRPVLHDLLFREQRDDGSWRPTGGQGGGDGRFGPNYCTAMCVLALTVEYRYLPIYQRGEEPTDK